MLNKFALLICLLYSVSSAGNANCVDALNNDPRFNWQSGWPDLERKPPNLYGTSLGALLSPHLEALPKGLNAEEQAFYEGIFGLLRDKARVFSLIEKTVAEIELRTEPSREARLLAIMKSYEERHGFKVAEVVGAQLPREWLAYVAKGYTFIDKVDSSVSPSIARNFAQIQDGHWQHGELTHRFQLYLVVRDIEEQPAAYGSPSDVLRLYKLMGCREWTKTLDWSKTGLVENGRRVAPLSLFFQLFDTLENNPSSPGFFYEYREYWPGLPLS